MPYIDSRTFKKDDRVILRSDSRYAAEPCNPKCGTQYACVGTIYRVDRFGDWEYKVAWDNGINNTYRGRDLQLERSKLSEDNPNATYKSEKGCEISKPAAVKMTKDKWAAYLGGLEKVADDF